MKILSIIFGLLRMIFGSAGQAEGALKQENKQRDKENKIISKQRDNNVNNVADADKLFDRVDKSDSK